ncbi:MAG TPA: c-type cytochrome [Pyrinomonadaceae bacterium]|nr:c-type cytochrome [Pyrinomonadaceae bacterium]
MASRGKLIATCWTLLLLGAVSGGGYSVRHAGASAAQKKSAGSQPERAKILYANNCARCHGADGSGQTAMGRAFEAPNLTDAGWWKRERPNDKRLTTSIRDGRNRQRMPAFGQELSKSEIAALVRLVRTFGGK